MVAQLDCGASRFIYGKKMRSLIISGDRIHAWGNNYEYIAILNHSLKIDDLVGWALPNKLGNSGQCPPY